MAEEPPSRRNPTDTQTGVDLGRRLAPGTLLAGRYRIVEVAGVGGMGVVYRGRDEELGTDVALKVLRPDLGTDPQWVERFRRELLLAREVSHRNVVRIHDIGESEGLRFLTMRYVEGRSLLDILEKDGPLPIERALVIARQIAEALAVAHEAGVVHRDLKPGNILLEADDTAYVSDFGVARFRDRDGLTRAGAVVGTPDYLSPEQISGDPVDGRSDLYALGILFYEILTGQLPFKGDSQAETLAQRLTGRIRDVGETGVRVPRWVQAVIRRCLARNPARRYQTARELLADLDRRRATDGWSAPSWRAAVAGALLLAAAGWGVHRQRAGLPLLPGAARAAPATSPAGALHAVAVLPLADETGDPALAWTATGVAEMLAARLSESPEIRVLDALRIFRTLRDLRLTGPLDEPALRRLAELLEADRLVTGSVRRAGSALRLDLRLVVVGPGESVGTEHLGEESAHESGLFRLVTDLSEGLLRRLGAEPGPEGAEPQTTSLGAARAYREGRERLLVGDSVNAAPAFERAVAADPGFAAALERLSEAYQSLGYHEKAALAAERAAKAVGSGQSRLGYRIRARLALLRGEPAGAEKSYAELVRRYPNDTEALLDLAAAQERQGDLARAVETLRKVTTLDRSDPRGWFLLGKNTIRMGDSQRALGDSLVRALALYSQLHNEQGEGDVLNAMGVAFHELGDYPQALEKYSAAAVIRKRLGDQRGVATSLKNRARVYQALGRFDEAEPDLRKAAETYERIGDQAGLADVTNDMGAVHEGRGDYAAARAAYQQALKIRRNLGDDRQLAQSYDNIGYMFFLEGEYDSALVYWQQALDLRRRIGEKGGVVLSLQNMGFLQTAQGRWDEATKSFLAALQMGREIDFKTAVAVSHGNIGVLQHYEGRYAAALTSFDEALKVLEGLGDKRGLAEFTLKKAAVLLELGRLDEARQRLDAAEPWVRETSNREQSSDYYALLGEWHARRGERGEARRALAKAVAEAEASRGRTAILRARLAEAAATSALGDAASALPALTAASREAEALGEALLRIRAAEALARAELARGRLREAEAAARRALEVARRGGWGAGLYRLHALFGRILEKQGDAAGAAREYRESARLLASLREGLDAERRGSFDELEPVREVEAWVAAHAPAR